MSTTKRDPDSYPSSAGATDPTWWTPVWDTAVVGEARLGATHLGSSDLNFSRSLFEDVLGAATRETAKGLEFRWKSGTLRVHSCETPGVTAMTLTGGPPEGLCIGPTTLRPTTKG